VIRAVLDTNILISASLVSEGYSARIVDLWEKRRFVLLLSPVLLEEVDEVLR
jgi:predicted nucleic acid-binding protein